MCKLNLSQNAKNAIFIGTTCSLSYLAVYVSRGVLSVVSIDLTSLGIFTDKQIGTLSSVFLMFYALGQLVNGILGDRIKARNMIVLGLALAAIGNLAFMFTTSIPFLSYLIYGSTGFFLSMIYAPMSKVVAENTEPIHATRCSLGYTFAALIGNPVAGIIAMFLAWKGVFSVTCAFLFVMSAVTYFVFVMLEKRGIVKYNQYIAPKESGSANGVKLLIKNRILKFTLIAILTGVVRTAVTFWLPAYYHQRLGFSNEKSALIFTIVSLFIASSAFVSVFVFERLKQNMDLTIFLSFTLSAIGFLGALFIKNPIINVVFIAIAVFSNESASTMIWSRYCPSLRDTGMVSTVTGFLDFVSYAAASVSSKVFGNIVGSSSIGWGGLVLIWFALMFVGVIISVPLKKKIKA